MTRSKKVLTTREILFSFIDRQHTKHAEAEAYFRFFANEGYHIYTPSFAVMDTYAQIRKHMSFSIAKDFLRTIYLGSIEIIYPDESTTKNAIKLILSNTSDDLTMDQALINVIADKNQIPQIASFDYQYFYFGIQPFTLPY